MLSGLVLTTSVAAYFNSKLLFSSAFKLTCVSTNNQRTEPSSHKERGRVCMGSAVFEPDAVSLMASLACTSPLGKGTPVRTTSLSRCVLAGSSIFSSTSASLKLAMAKLIMKSVVVALPARSSQRT